MEAPGSAYRVILHPRAVGDVDRLPGGVAGRVLHACAALGADPFPPGKKMRRLQGTAPPTYRLRVGDYRALYRVDAAGRRVFVLRVVHRGDLERAVRGLPENPTDL